MIEIIMVYIIWAGFFVFGVLLFKSNYYLNKEKHLLLFIDRFKSKKGRSNKPKYDYDFGYGWYGKYHYIFEVKSPFLRIFKDNILIFRVELFEYIKIGEKELEFFSQCLEGEKPTFIDVTYEDIILHFSDKIYQLSQLNFHEIESEIEFADGSKNNLLCNGRILPPHKVDLSRIRRIKRTEPIYEKVEKTDLELYTEIYEIIQNYEGGEC